MSLFEYVAVLTSIIIGLGAASVLDGRLIAGAGQTSDQDRAKILCH